MRIISKILWLTPNLKPLEDEMVKIGDFCILKDSNNLTTHLKM